MNAFDDFMPISEIISLQDKKAVVTGAARGIGAAISYRLAEAGASVLIADINGHEAEETSQALIEKGYEAIPLQCDISKEEDINKMVNIAADKMGAIDILVNNAGIYPRISLEEMTAEEFDKVIAINLKGTFLCSRAASQQMIRQRRGGCIINLASIDAVHPSHKGFVAYDASKGAVLTLTKSLALDLGQHDIRVNAIAPGGILTQSMLSNNNMPSAAQDRAQDRAQLRAFMARMPLGRMGRPDDIARVALFLASEMASYITGTLIVVDGGYLIS